MSDWSSMSKQLTCIIIEDEPLAREKLEQFISKVSFLTLISSFENGLEAINSDTLKEIDLIFLDIQMKELNGIEFLQSMEYPASIIITSAYREYALDGYDYNVSAYLLKPFSKERFDNLHQQGRRWSLWKREICSFCLNKI